MPSTKFRVAICGGGVGGLIMAVALSRYPDIQVDVYEAAREFAEIGAGIGMWPRTWKIMEALGLHHDLEKVAILSPIDLPKVAFNFRKGDETIGFNFYQLITPGGMISFHRPEFQAAILKHLSPSSCRTHTSKRLISYTYSTTSESLPSTPPQSPINLQFQDGSTATCDLLIGADGINSSVRASMLRAEAAKSQAEGKHQEAQDILSTIDAKWSGTSMYRTTFSADALNRQLPGHRALREPMLYIGTNTQVVCYPISRGTRINFAASCARYDLENTPFEGPWVQDVSCDEFIHDFDRWEPEVQALLQCTQNVSRWALHTLAPLKSYISDHAALIGDAAHAMLPYQGAGAGQAIEDAYILSTLLGHPKTTLSTLQQALSIFDAIRRPFSQHVAEKSRENGLLFTLNFPELRFDRGQESFEDRKMQRLSKLCLKIRRNWEWAWDTTIDEDLERAIRMLEES